MNCEKSQEMISAYLDGELSATEAESLHTHFSLCSDCAKLYSDFESIVGFCGNELSQDSIPPNSQALWCRINNIIESEIEETRAAEEIPETAIAKTGLFSRAFSFSTAQVFASVISIAIVSSLLTIIGIKNLSSPNDGLAGFESEPSVFEKVLAKLGVAETPGERATRRLMRNYLLCKPSPEVQ